MPAPTLESAPPLRPATAHRRSELYAEALEIIRTEFASELDVDAVARRLWTSRRHLQRVLAESGQTTFGAELRAARFSCAIQLLTRTDLTVTEVARRTGYRQPAHFAKAFRARYGRSPSDLRREARIARARRDAFAPVPAG